MSKRRRSESSGASSHARFSAMKLPIVVTCALLTCTVVSGFHASRIVVSVQTTTTTTTTARSSVKRQFSAGEIQVDVLPRPSSSSKRDYSLSKKQSSSRFSALPPWLQINDESTPEEVQHEVQWLEFALLEHSFSVSDISDIVKAIYFSASGDIQKILGSIKFCKLILRLEEPGDRYNLFVTKNVLLASILHHSECVAARRDGVYEKVVRSLRIERASSSAAFDAPTIYLESLSKNLAMNGEDRITLDEEIFPESSVALRRKLSVEDQPMRPQDIELFPPDALRLAQAASRIKRSEILADVVLTDGRALTPEEYSSVRDLLLTVMEDWRALAIRCVASLYRLEGVLESIPSGTGEYLPRTNDSLLTARHSIRVYANLSQRLGLHRLKSQLEANSFRILYPRQYSAASTLFQQKGESMKAVSAFLSSQMTKLLHEDDSIMSQLEDLEISSRVKEPYSFWKKLLKKRKEQSRSSQFLAPATEISVADVPDGVALRVILKVRKSTLDESDETTRSRERMLCYYVHRLIRSKWPAIDESRVKDYIQNPKPNGYQSLHHTSIITRNSQQFPFEVQVRSEEMHRIAEFGVAAHWDYKLGDKTLRSLPPSESGKMLKPPPAWTDVNVETKERVVTMEGGESSYISALQTARQTLVRSNVFVFLAGAGTASSSALEEGQLLSLPAGAQVVDILSDLRKDYSNLPADDSELEVWKNGKLALLDEIVRNGDVLLLQDMTSTRESSRGSTNSYLVSL